MWYKILGQSLGPLAPGSRATTVLGALVKLIPYQPIRNVKTGRFSEDYIYKKLKLLKQFC